MIGRAPSVIQYGTIEALSTSVLERLVSKISAHVGSPQGPDVVAWMHEVATHQQVALPLSLLSALDGIEALASEQGRQLLFAAGHERDVDLAALYGERSPADIATLAYLEHSDVFLDARAHLRSAREAMFTVFACLTPRPVRRVDIERRRHDIEQVVCHWLQTQKRPESCRVTVSETATQVVVDVVSCCMPAGVSDPHGALLFVPVKVQDTLAFDMAGYCVAVRAGSEQERAFYRALAGTLLFGDREAYPGNDVFQIQRLLALSLRKSTMTDMPGLERVDMRRLDVDDDDTQVTWKCSQDLRAHERRVEDVLDAAHPCTRVELDLYLTGRRSPCTVALCPPNHIRLDDRSIGSITASYLKTLGIVCPR